VSSYEKYHKSTIDCSKIQPHTKELVDRCGTAQAAAQYALVSPQTVQRILHGVHCTVQQATARKILIALEHKRIEDRRFHRTHAKLLKARQDAARIDQQREREDRQERLAGY